MTSYIFQRLFLFGKWTSSDSSYQNALLETVLVLGDGSQEMEFLCCFFLMPWRYWSCCSYVWTFHNICLQQYIITDVVNFPHYHHACQKVLVLALSETDLVKQAAIRDDRYWRYFSVTSSSLKDQEKPVAVPNERYGRYFSATSNNFSDHVKYDSRNNLCYFSNPW